MKITLHLEMEEGDYIGILQLASMKGMPTNQIIMTAIREYLTREAQSFRPAGGQEPEQDKTVEGNSKGNES